ncbi:MAG: hypothetical protein HC802_23520, partial [Caldilineaceae bacterium]|nr:hypothetical protein [Caldilineaceae bacterium]
MPTPQSWWQRLYAVIGGVSIRTKILGIILALTLLLGLATTVQVRIVMTDTLVAEVDNRGLSVVSDLAGRSVSLLASGDIAAIQSLLTETIANHPDTRYAIVLDSAGNVVAHTFADEVPPDLLALVPLDLTSAEQHRHYENY